MRSRTIVVEQGVDIAPRTTVRGSELRRESLAVADTQSENQPGQVRFLRRQFLQEGDLMQKSQLRDYVCGVAAAP